jgi:hypothetical protein
MAWNFRCLHFHNNFQWFIVLEAMIYCFNVEHTKGPDMRIYQSEHNMLLNFPRCLSILLLQTSKTDNNALHIDAIYNLKLRKT